MSHFTGLPSLRFVLSLSLSLSFSLAPSLERCFPNILFVSGSLCATTQNCAFRSSILLLRNATFAEGTSDLS